MFCDHSPPPRAVSYRPADALSLGELTLLWREIYANYPASLPFTQDELTRFIALSSISLSQSQVAVIEDRPIGLALVGLDGSQAWLGGFGVTAPHRRAGIGQGLIREQCRILDQAGLTHTRLETLSTEPSHRLFRKNGFSNRRSLYSFSSPTLGKGSDPLITLELESLPDLHRRLHRGVSTAAWQRNLTNVLHAVARDHLTILGWRNGHNISAYAVEQTSGGLMQVIDAAAEDARSAEALIMSLAARARGRRLTLNDEPAESPISAALRRYGAAPRAQTSEMQRLAKPVKGPQEASSHEAALC